MSSVTITSLQDLENLETSYILQKQFNLNDNPTSWLAQFILEIFQIFFLPILIVIFFIILTSPWFTRWFSHYIPDEYARYLTVVLIFFVIVFYLTRTYIVVVLNQ